MSFRRSGVDPECAMAQRLCFSAKGSGLEEIVNTNLLYSGGPCFLWKLPGLCLFAHSFEEIQTPTMSILFASDLS